MMGSRPTAQGAALRDVAVSFGGSHRQTAPQA